MHKIKYYYINIFKIKLLHINKEIEDSCKNRFFVVKEYTCIYIFVYKNQVIKRISVEITKETKFMDYIINLVSPW